MHGRSQPRCAACARHRGPHACQGGHHVSGRCAVACACTAPQQVPSRRCGLDRVQPDRVTQRELHWLPCLCVARARVAG